MSADRRPAGATASDPLPLSRRDVLGGAARMTFLATVGAGLLGATELLRAPGAHADGLIGRQAVLDRAFDRFHKRPAYSQALKPGLDGFRQDCSGFISCAWNTVPAGSNGWTTYNLPQISHQISAADLRAGDILLAQEHVMLFTGWTDAARSHLQVLEHGGGSSGLEPPEFNTYSGLLSGYAPWRYNRVDELDPYGSIRVTWLDNGGVTSPVGPPVLPEIDSQRGGRFQDFRDGMIIWNRATNQAWMVHGLILTCYRDQGSELAWGFPVMDEFDASAAPDGTRGRFQKFENALILWSAPTGAHLLHGEIRAYFEANNDEQRHGYPTSDEIAEGSGFRQEFQQGVIHWNPSARATWQAR